MLLGLEYRELRLDLFFMLVDRCKEGLLGMAMSLETEMTEMTAVQIFWP